MFGELQKFPEHNMNQRSHLTHKRHTGRNSFWSEVIFEAFASKMTSLRKNFFGVRFCRKAANSHIQA
jgi:hypothetical protein